MSHGIDASVAPLINPPTTFTEYVALTIGAF